MAYAKVNLSLDILKRRNDGYHDLRMVAQTVSLCDEIMIDLTEEKEISVVCNLDYLPADGRNLAVAAARRFLEKTGVWQGGVSITLEKRIPVCAGLGGGSADAAAVLRGLNTLFSAGLSADELCEMALRLGSDVPFCICGGTQLMGGRGEILTPLPSLPDCYIVICMPKAPMPTQTVFGLFEAEKERYHPDIDGMIKALEFGKLPDIGWHMYNALEDIVAQRVSDIPLIREAFLHGGAIGSCMTGSGTAVAGMFDDKVTAEKAAGELSRTYPDTFLSTPVLRYM